MLNSRVYVLIGRVVVGSAPHFRLTKSVRFALCFVRGVQVSELAPHRPFVLLFLFHVHSFSARPVGASLRTRLCLVLCLGLCPKNPQAAIVRLGELFS